MGLFDGISLGGVSAPSLGDVSLGGAPSALPQGEGPSNDASGVQPNPNGLGALETGRSNVNIGQAVSIPPGSSLNGNPAFTHVGTLNVGDRFVSSDQNSAPTVAARSPQAHPRDSMDVHVVSSAPAPEHEAAPPPPEEERSANAEARESGGDGSTFFSGSSIEEEEERRRREREQMAHLQRAYHQVASSGAHSVSSSRPPQIQNAGPIAADRPSQRYVLEAHDVHNMGGSPSRIQISNRQTGEVLRDVRLPQGDSRTVVDLPPGDYQFTAVAGERPAGSQNPDRLDNFRVDVFQGNSGGASGPPAGQAPNPS